MLAPDTLSRVEREKVLKERETTEPGDPQDTGVLLLRKTLELCFFPCRVFLAGAAAGSNISDAGQSTLQSYELLL